jgi:hypothetical protein
MMPGTTVSSFLWVPTNDEVIEEYSEDVISEVDEYEE